MSEQERDFLDEGVVEEALPEVTPEPEPAAEKGETEAPPEAPPAEEPSHDKHVPLAALMAERDKRQEEARQRQQLEQELARYRQQEPQPTFYEAPDKYVEQIEARATQRLHSALEAQARETYPDYDDVFNELQEYAQANPAVVPQIMESANPALAAYKFGKQIRELKQMQDPDAYRQKIAAEVRAEVEAEFRNKEADRLKTAQALPPDLTANRSAKGTFLPASDSVFDEIF